MRRIPTVFEVGLADVELNTPESTSLAPFELGATFTFLRERLAKAVWHNSYDARTDQLIWWWSRKAEARLQVSVFAVGVLLAGKRPTPQTAERLWRFAYQQCLF